MNPVTASRIAFVLPCWAALKIVGPFIADRDNPMLKASLRDLASNGTPLLADAGLLLWSAALVWVVALACLVS